MEEHDSLAFRLPEGGHQGPSEKVKRAGSIPRHTDAETPRHTKAERECRRLGWGEWGGVGVGWGGVEGSSVKETERTGDGK